MYLTRLGQVSYSVHLNLDVISYSFRRTLPLHSISGKESSSRPSVDTFKASYIQCRTRLLHFSLSTSGLTISASTLLRNLYISKKIPSQCRYQVHTLDSSNLSLLTSTPTILGLCNISQFQVNKARVIMSSATSAITYTSVYTDSEPDRAFWGADDEEISEGAAIYFVDSPTAESPGYVTESDPEEDPEEYEDDETKDGPFDYPMDGGDDGDDDDGDSSRDDANDEDEDDEDEEEEEEEHLAPANSTIVVPVDEPVFPPEGTEPAEVERLLAMTTPSPSPPISLSPPSAGERLARCTTLPAHSSPLSMPSHTTIIGAPDMRLERVLCRPTKSWGDKNMGCHTVDDEERRQGIRDVGYGIRDTWIDPAEAVPEIAPMTMGEVNTRVTELAELLEHDTQDLYALLEDAQG
ncbi:hypothetical protein Tco_0194693 [Tanacetum coccineum]